MLETEDHISMGVEKRQSEKKNEIQCVKAAGLLKGFPKEVYCNATPVP
jgi:hypothetical protein